MIVMSWASRTAVFAVILMGVVACTGGGPPSSKRAMPPLKFLTAQTALVHAGEGAEIPVRVTDPDAMISEYGLIPSGMSFHDSHGGTATITGAPGGDAGGYYHVQLTAADGTRQVSQELTLSVAETPYFPSLDNTKFGANEYHGNQDVILATGYPMPRLSYTGTLPSGFTFKRISTGMVMISGSPGTFEGPCSSQITVVAVSVTGTARLPVTIKLGDWRCPLNVAGPWLDHIVVDTIIGKGGDWIWENGKKVAAWAWEHGRAVLSSDE
jgi:hypothetical protein